MSAKTPVTSMWQRHSIRGDIQGLRAVAVLLVLIYHVWPSVLPGGYIGVDVFFVISGYLIVGSLVKELEREGRVGLLDFYRRRAKRLMPAALTVLSVVLVATVFFLPQARWEDTFLQVVSSALYVQNWYLSWASVDYLAAENAPSPVLHYWSLSIEEQFYILWPLAMVIVGWSLGRLKLPVRTIVGSLLSVVFLSSLASSITTTINSPPEAYFFSHTRFWEIALGGLIATWLPNVTLTDRVRALLFALGLGLVLVASFTYGDVAFPGWAALLPVIGTGLILIAGPFNVGRFAGLDTPVLRYVGDISYSLYLWHWPIIVFYMAWKGDIGILSGLGIIVVAFAVSHLSYRNVEERFRYRNTTISMGPLTSGLAGAALVAGCSLLLSFGVMSSASPVSGSQTNTNDYPGPAALLEGAAVPENIPPIPAAAYLSRDKSEVYESGCHQNLESSEVSSCVLGEESADFEVAVVGSSHSVNWLPAIDLLGQRNGWRVVSLTKSACGFHQLGSRSCQQWHENLKSYLIANPPDLVIVGESVDKGEHQEHLERVSSRLEFIARMGVPILGISPTPKIEKSPGDCLPDRVADCESPRNEALRENAFEVAQRRLSNVDVIDMSDGICGEETCGVVVGNLVTLRDRHHLTATYSRALAPYLEKRIADLGKDLAPIVGGPWDKVAPPLAAIETGRPLLRCGPAGGTTQPFVRDYTLELDGDSVRLRRGDYVARERNFEVWDGRLRGETIIISGEYREGSGGLKKIRLEGTVVDGVMIAGGKRGPRSCSLHWARDGGFNHA